MGEVSHAAEGAALGFYYQSLYALLALISLSTDDAAIAVEQLDDVQLKADGQTLVYQLKHSITAVPPSITIKSTSFWRTIKVWVDISSSISLPETTFYLVAVAGIAPNDALNVLKNLNNDRTSLVEAMTAEARRVQEARTAAQKSGAKLPYGDRIEGCRAFLTMSETDRLNLLRRITINAETPTIDKIEEKIAEQLKILPADQRAPVVKRLVEWWDRQILYSLCGQRPRVIARDELQTHISNVIAEIEQDKLVPEFETVTHPEEYMPDGMLARQIDLVGGRPSDHDKAIREEWKAREQRARWLHDNPAMASMITDYDIVLQEHWCDRHKVMREDCVGLDNSLKQKQGLDLLRWTHNDAPTTIRPVSEGWGAAYYVRGSYQVLAINLKVGWHPDYEALLKEVT